MANTLTEVTPKLLAQGLLALREMSIMPRLVNRQYEGLAGQRGSTIDVPIPSAIAVQDVTPAATPPSTADVAPTSVPIQLNRWKEAPFYMTDKDLLEAQQGTLPMQASEALKSIANEVDQFILGLANQFFGFVEPVGSSGPFSDNTTKDATAVRTTLNKQLAPMQDRYMVLDPDAEGNALDLRAFQDLSYSGSAQAIIEGNLNRKLGFQWWMDQNVQSHTAGTAASVQTAAAGTVGDKSIAIDTGTGTLTVGDIVTFAGHTQTYVITTAVADVSSATMAFEPGLQASVADNEGVTLVNADHPMNIGFHRDAIAFATRPLLGSQHPSSIIEQAVDPISGLSLRLEVSREHKRDRFSWDVLYGANVIRRELGARLAGAK